MEEIVTRNGEKKRILAKYNIYEKEYYIISSTEVFTKAEDGNFDEFDIKESKERPNSDKNLERTRFLLREMLKKTESLDVIER